MAHTLRTFYTTEAVAALVGVSGTLARNRIAAGEWRPSAQTSSGKALFSEAARDSILQRELERKDGRSSTRRKRIGKRRASSTSSTSSTAPAPALSSEGMP